MMMHRITPRDKHGGKSGSFVNAPYVVLDIKSDARSQ